MTMIEEEELEQALDGGVQYSEEPEVDFFEGTSSNPVPLFVEFPDVLRYPAKSSAGYREILVPICIRGSIIHKVLAYEIRFSGSGVRNLDGRSLAIGRIFSALESENNVNEELIGVKINQIIKSLKGNDGKTIGDKMAKAIQSRFLAPINAVLKEKPIQFTNEEIRQLTQINRLIIRFQDTVSTPSLSISERYSSLPYTNKDYIESIRQLAFVQFFIWQEIRKRFKEECYKEYSELLELLADKTLHGLLKNSTGALPSKIRKLQSGKIYAERIYRIQYLMIQAALKLDEEILMESLFISFAYRHQTTFHGDFWLTDDGIKSLKSDIDLPYMRKYLEELCYPHGLAKPNGRNTGFVREHSNTKYYSGCVSTFSPYALFLPYGPDELGLYAALFATDRIQLSALLRLTTNDVLLRDSRDQEISNVNYASRLKINAFKGRNGKKDGLIYSKGEPFYELAKSLKQEFDKFIDANLIDNDGRGIFSSILNSNDFSEMTLFRGNLSNIFQFGPKCRLFTMLTLGTKYYKTVHDSVRNPAFLNLLASKLGFSETRNIVSITNITQSRIYADQAMDLSDVGVSDSMSLAYSEDLYRSLKITAPGQHHSIDTRLNVYYQNSNDRIIIAAREKFAAQVGEEMVKAADLLAQSKSHSTVLLDLEAAKRSIGLTPSKNEVTAEELLIQADVQGFVTTETGFIFSEQDGVTYIIKSPLHAHLIKSKIVHIDSEIERLKLSNTELVPRAIAERMLLSLVLEQFDQSIIQNAEVRYGDFVFPFPSLVSTLGGFLSV
ncbi:MAG: hypothetical protein JJ879_13455 [Sneathiella sp.]|nr:hypothetical protein [Sneathiella sp.]